jgi:hypothetical protein
MHLLVGESGLGAFAGFVAAVIMIRAGISTHVLVPRRVPRPCASCGRELQGGTCRWCAGR